MIGRAVVSDPLIFNRLKGLSVPNLDEAKKEYLLLSEKYNSLPKYRKNILKWMGRNVGEIEED